MAKEKNSTVSLSAQSQKIVKKALSSRKFATVDEVVDEAFKRWDQYEKAKAGAQEHLRALIQEGIDSGPGREIDFDELKAEMHAEFTRRKDKKRLVA
jgi:antitoxin ParD1/3/4